LCLLTKKSKECTVLYFAFLYGIRRMPSKVIRLQGI
jgi:hypothetical protein